MRIKRLFAVVLLLGLCACEEQCIKEAGPVSASWPPAEAPATAPAR
jgi:hypothetical protein